MWLVGLAADSAARLRFYRNRGSQILDFSYLQPALQPGTDRVSGLLPIVLHADPDFAGADANTIARVAVRRFLENYQIQYEGTAPTDSQQVGIGRSAQLLRAK